LGKDGKIGKSGEFSNTSEVVCISRLTKLLGCVRDGKKESALWDHEKSLLEMSIFDEVRRAIRLLIMDPTNLPGLSRHRFAAREDMCFLQESKVLE
jgi:hypothetical protein